MKIKRITSQHRNDFSYDAECRHCGKDSHCTTGYDDHYYLTKVLPGRFCPNCGKDEDGKTEEQVIEETIVVIHGDPSTKVATLKECNETPGSWCETGAKDVLYWVDRVKIDTKKRGV